MLVALYENDTPFEPVIVDLGDERSRAAFLKLWPMGKMPVLVDAAGTARCRNRPSSSNISPPTIPAPANSCPADPELARQTRLADRFYDFYVHEPMQKIVVDTLRPAGATIRSASSRRAPRSPRHRHDRDDMRSKHWAIGDAFTLADCAAFPALHYANKVARFPSRYSNLAGYFERLSRRPSVLRVIKGGRALFRDVPVYGEKT